MTTFFLFPLNLNPFLQYTDIYGHVKELLDNKEKKKQKENEFLYIEWDNLKKQLKSLYFLHLIMQAILQEQFQTQMEIFLLIVLPTFSSMTLNRTNQLEFPLNHCSRNTCLGLIYLQRQRCLMDLIENFCASDNDNYYYQAYEGVYCWNK